ncbi:hypothetical protein TcasGA2_TC005695 [Tribolium castaneum]|uniref:Uncharacterized protein n=1 Tax=Tribolium castaneum TaxID=7070 RepID=D6WWR6_TRICA|nr:hypothetical protein TcasGA2_TC005695 [Tribolium castaneum]
MKTRRTLATSTVSSDTEAPILAKPFEKRRLEMRQATEAAALYPFHVLFPFMPALAHLVLHTGGVEVGSDR